MSGIRMDRVQEILPAIESLETSSSHKSNHYEAHTRQTSVEQLCDDVHEMERSSNGGGFPSLSSGSDREELRVDLELQDGTFVEKSNKTLEALPHGTKTSSSKNTNKPPLILSEWNASTRTSPKRNGTSGKVVNGERMPRPTPTVKKEKKSPPKVPKSENGTTVDPSEVGLDNRDLGPFLLKQARDLISSGDSPSRALKYAVRAAKSFEKFSDDKTNLDLVMCLHVIASIHCNLGKYNEAIPILERSIEISELEQGHEYTLSKFSGHMQLGDTYAMLGQLESSIRCYTSGLQVQKQALGDRDPRVGETCRYLAEAYVQALQFEEAERLCQMALDIHREGGLPGSLEETADRRLLGLIFDAKGNYESSLEHLVLASMAMMSNGQEAEAASLDCSIGDTYLALARYDDAVFAYQKALTVLKSTKGENHPSIASVFVRLSDLYNKTGKFREAKSYCENALRIYGKPPVDTSSEEIASGLADIAAIYESVDEYEEAIKLLKKTLSIYDNGPGQQSTIAGIEAQMGALYYITGSYVESYTSFKDAIAKLRAWGERKSAFFGIVLNQMGLACLQLCEISEAADLFEESRCILEQEYGPYHGDTLAVCSNLAGAYDAMGRLDKAIKILEHVVGIREEKLGTAGPDVDDEKRRLAHLLREAGRSRHRKTKSLEMLLDTDTDITAVKNDAIAV